MLREYTSQDEKFVYDDTMFELNILNEQQLSTTRKYVLNYIGAETDGSKINIPEGVTDCSYMFVSSTIKSIPKIPDGVIRADSMFYACNNLEYVMGTLGKNIIYFESMFANCNALKYVDIIIPATAYNVITMFADCTSLITAKVRFEDKVRDCEKMFFDCKELRNLKININLETVVNAARMFYGCENLPTMLHFPLCRYGFVFQQMYHPVAKLIVNSCPKRASIFHVYNFLEYLNDFYSIDYETAFWIPSLIEANNTTEFLFRDFIRKPQ